MSERSTCGEEPTHKKQKIDSGLLEYVFRDNPNLVQPPDIPNIDMGHMRAVYEEETLYTSGCASCAALIIVAKMDHGETWHGMNHCDDVVGSEAINKGFELLVKEIEDEGESKIKFKRCYLITCPEFKDIRTNDANKLDYKITVYSPEAVCDQIEYDTPDSFKSSIDVQVSSPYIDVKYDDGSA